MSMNQLDAVIEQRAQQRPRSSVPAIFGRHAIYAYNMYSIKSARVIYIYNDKNVCVCVHVETYPYSLRRTMPENLVLDFDSKINNNFVINEYM